MNLLRRLTKQKKNPKIQQKKIYIVSRPKSSEMFVARRCGICERSVPFCDLSYKGMAGDGNGLEGANSAGKLQSTLQPQHLDVFQQNSWH